MQYRKLGHTGVEVSTLCLGAMTFGEPDQSSFMHGVAAPAEVAHDVLDRAVDAGINFIDNADVYGQNGLSERVLGDWFKRWGKRDEVVLATKFRFRMADGPNGTGASRYRIVKCVEDSLRRLQTDRIDLYQIHMQDPSVPEDEILRALDDLVRAGKVLYVGCSNYTANRIVNSLWTADRLGLTRFATQQMQYSLVHRGIEREHVPVARDHGVGILPWSPLAGGFLTGKWRRDEPPPEGSRLDKWKDRLAHFDSERNWRILDAVLAVADETGAPPAAVSLAWLIAQPGVTSAIFGARNVDQLQSNLKAADLELSQTQLDHLTEASAFDVGYPYDFIEGVNGSW